MPTHVTRFEAQDASAVRELIVQGLAERWGRYDPRFNPDLENFAEHYNSSVILVAKRGSRIVGVGVLQPEADGVGRIVRMSVAGDCRRRGIGTLILEGLLQAARERGYESAVLETTASWESAVRFYVSRGFIPTEARDGDQGFVLALTESGHPMQIQCAAILFDLDGVLIDSTDSVTRHWQQWAERHNLDLAEIMKVAHGRRTVETMRLIAPHLATAEEAQRFAAMEAADTQGVIAVDGALPLLSRLPPEAWAIVTSGTRDLATARLKSRGLPIPRVMVTAEDVVNGKPDPEPYLVAARLMGIPAAQCAVVEDSPAGIAAAHAAGMRPVAIASTHAYHELDSATLVARQLSDIQVDSDIDGRLVIHVSNLDRLDSA